VVGEHLRELADLVEVLGGWPDEGEHGCAGFPDPDAHTR
jgi:hypothetical protein